MTLKKEIWKRMVEGKEATPEGWELTEFEVDLNVGSNDRIKYKFVRKET